MRVIFRDETILCKNENSYNLCDSIKQQSAWDGRVT